MKSKNLADKLVTIVRTVNVYNASNDLIDEIDIDLPLNILRTAVSPKDDDAELYDGYELSDNQLIELNKFLNKKININLESNSYILECTGIYKW